MLIANFYTAFFRIEIHSFARFMALCSGDSEKMLITWKNDCCNLQEFKKAYNFAVLTPITLQSTN